VDRADAVTHCPQEKGMPGWIRSSARFFAVAMAAVISVAPLAAQVTTSSVRGVVLGPDGKGVEDARVVAIHVPSGTRYGAATRAEGRFFIPGMRVGGPYTVTASRIGFEPSTQKDITLSLGSTADLSFKLSSAAVQLTGVQVLEQTGVVSTSKTGTSTAISKESIERLPTISRRIGDFVRLTPQASGNSFAGQDNRLNNITVDGSFFNNSFGLQGQPGDRTGVAPISLDAIEQIQVNIAPYDVRQSRFTGAAVNTVTRSGTNEFTGSLYYFNRNERFGGVSAGATTLPRAVFDFGQVGARLGGPILKDKLFFFASFESDGLTEPGTTFRANAGGEPIGGTVTRVLASDLDNLSRFLSTNFQYSTGPYQGYSNERPSNRALVRLDLNANDNNKFSLRYTQLNSSSDILLSNSASLGFGTRRGNLTGLNFQSSNYAQQENIRSIVGEWNSLLGNRMSNNLIIGYTFQDENRKQLTSLFPFVDILQDGATYTSFGSEPFTPSNQLSYKTFQVQNNFQVFRDRHEMTFGGSLERYDGRNVFFDGSQSVYVYNSLNDFLTDANDFLVNRNRTTSPVTLRQFQVRYSNIPGQTEPVQPLRAWYGGLYAQDEWRATDRLRVTMGLRFDVPKFDATGYTNAQANALNFVNENGVSTRFETQTLPNSNILFSPRIGFNWDVTGDRKTVIRGGTGIFTGNPPYVWISNQIGNNGVITGFDQQTNTRNRPFNPNPDAYKPTTVTGAPAASYALALTKPDFRFPQLWRSNIAVERKLPLGFVGTVDVLYGRDVNGAFYYNANLPAAQSTFSGVDNRPRWVNPPGTPAGVIANRINANVPTAIVLDNQNIGRSYNYSAALERSFRNGLFVKGAYNYGMSRNTIDAGSIAAGSWTGNPIVTNPNQAPDAISGTAAGNRWFVTAAYRKEYFSFGATSIAFIVDAFQGNSSYTFGGDMNGDGALGNDLIYVPSNQSEMNFQQFTFTPAAVAGQPAPTPRVFTVAEQSAAWEAYINQDKYLRTRRGQYAQRGAVFSPMTWRGDLNISQDIFTNVAGRRNTIQLRADILNFTNLLNKDWGVGYALRSTQPLVSQGADAQGRALYRLRNFGTDLLGTGTQSSSFLRTINPGADVWRMQLGLRYIFGS
jgi:outer membrane receptor protein involved in Fe transport